MSLPGKAGPGLDTEPMAPSLPPWPRTPPTYGRVLLREVREGDVAMARELATDPYVPTTGTLPLNASAAQALDWVRRQQGRHQEGAGFSFTITEASTDTPVGHCGLWLRDLGDGQGSAGYSIIPSARGRGLATDALRALTDFGWGVPGLERIVLYVEPWNIASIRTAERSGYVREELLRDQEVAGAVRDVVRFAAARSS